MERKTAKRRAKGTGTLVLRGEVWYARWTHNRVAHMESTGIRNDHDDARREAEAYLMEKTEVFRIRRREDAIAVLLRQLQTEEERVADALARVRGTATVGGLAEAFRKSARRPDCSDGMLDHYCGCVSRLADSVGAETPVEEITSDAADAYAARLAKTAAPNTFNKAINALRLVWRTCVRDLPNPWNDIAHKRLDTHVRRALTDEEVDALLDGTTGEMRVLLAIGAYTGLRLGDAVHLRWSDFTGDAVRVVTRKTGAKVEIPIHPRLAKIVGKRKKTGLLVPGLAKIYDDPKRQAHVSRLTGRAFAKCGITTSVNGENGRARPDAGFHALRHTACSRWIAAGVPPHIVQSVVGHTTATMTAHYTHIESKDVLAAFRRVK